MSYDVSLTITAYYVDPFRNRKALPGDGQNGLSAHPPLSTEKAPHRDCQGPIVRDSMAELSTTPTVDGRGQVEAPAGE